MESNQDLFENYSGGFFLNDTRYNKQAYIWHQIAIKRKKRMKQLKKEVSRRSKFRVYLQLGILEMKHRIYTNKYKYTTKEYRDKFLKIKGYTELKKQVGLMLLKEPIHRSTYLNVAEMVIKVITDYKGE